MMTRQRDRSVMYIVLYMSTATRALSSGELHRLGQSAQTKNARLGITGLLLHDGQRFMQVLEGAREAVRDLMGIVTRDPRHREISFFLQERQTRRQFGQSAMNIVALDTRSSPASLRSDVAGLVHSADQPLVQAAFMGFVATGR